MTLDHPNSLITAVTAGDNCLSDGTTLKTCDIDLNSSFVANVVLEDI